MFAEAQHEDADVPVLPRAFAHKRRLHARKSNIDVVNHFADGLVPVQRQSHGQPYYLFCRQTTLSNARYQCRQQVARSIRTPDARPGMPSPPLPELALEN